jgi:hypothetical protein
MPNIEISNGELADKWTIIQIKISMLNNPDQQQELAKEVSCLIPFLIELSRDNKVDLLIEELKDTNQIIWNLMEKIYELHLEMNAEYVKLTLDITRFNQKRAFLKREIDILSKSNLKEAKSFFENPTFVIHEKKND